ncbi:MAG: beta-N-acetylhexosaminidase [Prevotella sp.]|nr:beta-N-acetylhexosaminidase [Prevotella sp.]
MKRILVIMASLLLTAALSAQDKADYRTVPLPESIKMTGKAPFVLNSGTTVAVPAGDEKLLRDGRFLAEYAAETTGLQLQVSTGKKKNAINLVIDKKIPNSEGYVIDVNAKGITVSGKTAAGVFYGIQTLRKSLPVGKSVTSVEFPSVKITDQPRFAYRGMMLDCGRHFFPISFIKKYIDLLALHGMNVFHWHLTEDQGWRIEIKKYPALTEKGSQRDQTVLGRNSSVYDGTPYGGFYTQDQAREIVKYAADRFITVIPEIDMPGHMLAALASYPNLGCTGGPYKVGQSWGVFPDVLCLGNPEVYTFAKDVLDEIFAIFPSKYIHIGGDETPTERWAKCPKCQKVMKDNNLTLNTLQGYFTNRIEKYIESKGRVMIGWDEILGGQPDKSAVVMSWRGAAPGEKAAKLGHDVIMSPTDNNYFDYYQTKDVQNEPLLIGGYIPIEKTYAFEPFADPSAKEANSHIIGVQANLWSEYITCPELAEYQVLPRMAALCEVQWMQPQAKNFQDFKGRSIKMKELYDAYGLTYAKFLWEEPKKE